MTSPEIIELVCSCDEDELTWGHTDCKLHGDGYGNPRPSGSAAGDGGGQERSSADLCHKGASSRREPRPEPDTELDVSGYFLRADEAAAKASLGVTIRPATFDSSMPGAR